MTAPPFRIGTFPRSATAYIETACPDAKCDRPYRIDEHHPNYAEIKTALEQGDRSVLRCYHRDHRDLLIGN